VSGRPRQFCAMWQTAGARSCSTSSARRIMVDADHEPALIGQPLQLDLPEPHTRTRSSWRSSSSRRSAPRLSRIWSLSDRALIDRCVTRIIVRPDSIDIASSRRWISVSFTESSIRLRRRLAPPPPKPRNGQEAGGAGFLRGYSRPERDTTAPFAPECQSFLDHLVAGFGPNGS
jgi:hypothetical protein